MCQNSVKIGGQGLCELKTDTVPFDPPQRALKGFAANREGSLRAVNNLMSSLKFGAFGRDVDQPKLEMHAVNLKLCEEICRFAAFPELQNRPHG